MISLKERILLVRFDAKELTELVGREVVDVLLEVLEVSTTFVFIDFDGVLLRPDDLPLSDVATRNFSASRAIPL